MSERYVVFTPGDFTLPSRFFAGWWPKSGLRRYSPDEKEAKHFDTFRDAQAHRIGHDVIGVCLCQKGEGA